MPIFKQDNHLAVISHQRILVERKRLGESHGEVQAMRLNQPWQFCYSKSDIMWVEIAKEDCLSLHPLLILLIAKVDILQSTASYLLSLIYTRQSPVEHSNFKGHHYAATKLNGCCELQWRKCQLPSAYVLKHDFFFDPFWEDIEACVPEPMHAELLRIEEDALHPNRDLHTVYD